MFVEPAVMNHDREQPILPNLLGTLALYRLSQ